MDRDGRDQDELLSILPCKGDSTKEHKQRRRSKQEQAPVRASQSLLGAFANHEFIAARLENPRVGTMLLTEAPPGTARIFSGASA
jgi:hypothetical protein